MPDGARSAHRAPPVRTVLLGLGLGRGRRPRRPRPLSRPRQARPRLRRVRGRSRAAPAHRGRSPAWCPTAARCPWRDGVPISMPSTSTSTPSGRWVASASTAICTSCWSSRPPENTSPLTRTGISTVTFSPRRTSIRSTCSMTPLMGLRCTAFGSASADRPDALQPDQHVRRLQRDHELVLRQREVAVLRALAVHDSGHTTRPAGRRDAPLPNSVRGSASIRTSGTVSHSSLGTWMRVSEV